MATETIAAEIDYPCSDGKPVAETDRHIDVLLDVRSRLKARYADRDDVYAAGNMFVYYEEDNPFKLLAPDGFVVFGVPNHLRSIFKTWEEGAYPAVVFEFTSKSTRNEDMDTKYEIYRDIWKVREYFLFDPTEEYLDPSLLGYRRVRGDFVPIKAVGGRLASKVLGITLSRDGEGLILTDTMTGIEVRTAPEQKAVDAERKAADAQREAADAQREAIDARHETANAQRKAVDAEQKTLAALQAVIEAQYEVIDAQRIALAEQAAREVAEAENAKLKAEIAALRRKKS